jgi:HEAT repeat protein
VEATRGIAFDPHSGKVFTSPDHSEAHEIFHLRVDDALELPPAVYAPYVQQLNSKDSDVRREAARILATIAPPSLEPLLLTFAISKDYALKQFAPLALSNLSTKASIAALAQMLVDNSPGSYESMTAAEDLGKTHDPAWLPLLLEASDQHNSMYLLYAAESGGDAAIAPLLTRLRVPVSRNSAIYALGHTGSRAAVPILISLLSTQTNPDEDSRNSTISASVALRQLTHLYPEQDAGAAPISTWHNRWQNWWLTNGQTAPIYKPEDCVADTKLP